MVRKKIYFEGRQSRNSEGKIYPIFCFLFIILNISLIRAQTDSLNIFWDPNPEPDMKEYRLYRSVNSTTDFVMIQTIPHPNTHTVDKDNIRPGNYYRYKMVAVDNDGNVSDFSETVGVFLPIINWSLSQIKSGQSTTVALNDVVRDLDDDINQLQFSVKNESHISVSISNNQILLSPSPQNYIGSASFNLVVFDSDSFWDQKNIQLEIVKEVQQVFELKFPDISFYSNDEYILWLDTCVTISTYQPSELVWEFTGMNHVLVNYDPSSRLATFSVESGWYGEETITVNAIAPDQQSRSITLLISVLQQEDQSSGEDLTARIIVFPNPFKLSQGHNYIVFDNLSPKVRSLMIFSITGEVLFKKKFEQGSVSNRWRWDVVDNQDRELPSGLYIYIFQDEDGNKLQSGKIAVIR